MLCYPSIHTCFEFSSIDYCSYVSPNLKHKDCNVMTVMCIWFMGKQRRGAAEQRRDRVDSPQKVVRLEQGSTRQVLALYSKSLKCNQRSALGLDRSHPDLNASPKVKISPNEPSQRWPGIMCGQASTTLHAYARSIWSRSNHPSPLLSLRLVILV